MDKVIKVGKGQTRSGAIVEYLRDLMEKGILDGLLIQKPTAGGRSYRHFLVTDPSELEDADPLVPVMPVSGATAVSRLTKLEAPSGRVGVVLRPCEVGAAVVLHKLLQARLKDVVVITFDCHGTLMATDFTAIIEDGVDPRMVMEKEQERRRLTCQTCQWTHHFDYDIDLGLFGVDEGSVLAHVKDEDLGKGLDDAPEELVKGHKDEIRARAKRYDEVLMGEMDRVREITGPEAFNRYFENCIVCHNCMDQCPVCYCNECFFESQTFRYEGDKMMLWARNRGGLEMPTDKAMFHLGRMAHMVLTCVYCGMCTQACPADIEVAAMFGWVVSQVKDEFGVPAAHTIDAPLPQATYKEDEMEPR
jgi:formate dehydrogenase subunit beta